MFYLIILGWLACGILCFYILLKTENPNLDIITYGHVALAVATICLGAISLILVVIVAISVWFVENMDKPIFKKKG